MSYDKPQVFLLSEGFFSPYCGNGTGTGSTSCLSGSSADADGCTNGPIVTETFFCGSGAITGTGATICATGPGASSDCFYGSSAFANYPSRCYNGTSPG